MNLLNIFESELFKYISNIFKMFIIYHNFFKFHIDMFRIKFEIFFRILRVRHGLRYYPNE